MLRKSYHIEMDIKLLELYSDYIISSFGQITATGLSKALGGSLSHDKITRLKFCEVKTKKEKRRATVTKNELTRNQLKNSKIGHS